MSKNHNHALKEDKMEVTLKQIKEHLLCIAWITTSYEKTVSDVIETVLMHGVGKEAFRSFKNDNLLIQGMIVSCIWLYLSKT